MQPKTLSWLSEQLVFVNTDISCWSGKKTLTPEDLGLDRTQLPPESLVSLGDKQLVDPKALRDFTTLRSAARRECLAVGTRFMGGYAVPVAKAPALLAALDALGQRYEDARAAFLAGYDGQLAAWTQQQPPEWQKLIQDALVPAEYVGGRLNFAVQAVQFSAPDPEVVAHEGLNAALSGLGDQVFHEIHQIAKEALEHSFQGKSSVTQKALSPLRSIRDKLDGLSFLDSRFRAVVGEIERLIAQSPAKGPIANGALTALTQFLSLAAQPQGLRTWAESAPIWQEPQSLLGLPAEAVPVPPSTEDDADSPSRADGVSVPPSDEDAVLVSPSTVDDETDPLSLKPVVEVEAVLPDPTPPASAPEPEPVSADWFFE